MIRGLWFTQAVIDDLKARSVSAAIGWEIVSETRNGSVHYLGHRHRRRSATFEFQIADAPDLVTGRRKRGYVFAKLTNAATGCMLHLYQEVNQPPSTFLIESARQMIVASLDSYGLALPAIPMPGDRCTTMRDTIVSIRESAKEASASGDAEPVSLKVEKDE